MVDRSFLPPATLEFVVIADTHHMLPTDAVEFASRRVQRDRVAYAIDRVNALAPDFVVHLGDVSQSFPDSEGFEAATDAARDQLADITAECYFVAGNHDVGDMPDPTMPTEPVTRESLAAYHDRFGRSWYSWTAADRRFVVINSQLLNADLPAAAAQRRWLRTELRESAVEPTFLFLHLPPFLGRPDEPSIGHYDTVAEPARSWLCTLIRETPVEHVVAAHTHFEFRNRIGNASLRVAPSPSFTRPGFAELFASCPPPERGRDDRPKLGIYLVRLHDGGPTFHFVRTGGRTREDEDRDGAALLTRPTGRLPASRTGVALAHPLGRSTRVPATFPSTVQQPVHDPYLRLGALRLGTGVVRTSLRDLVENRESRRHARAIRERGGTVVGTTLIGSGGTTAGGRSLLEAQCPTPSAPVDELEVRLAGTPTPTGAPFEAAMATVADIEDVGVGLSTVVPGRSRPDIQHDRHREGFRPADLQAVVAALGDSGATVDRALCHVALEQDPWETIVTGPDPERVDRVGAIDWLLPSIGVGDPAHPVRAFAALLATATRADARLYLHPFRELDRTMDVTPGLLDRRENPTAAYTGLRCLSTVLFETDREWTVGRRFEDAAVRSVGLTSPDRDVVLVVPAEAAATVSSTALRSHDRDRHRVLHLSSACIEQLALDAEAGGSIVVDEPTLFVLE